MIKISKQTKGYLLLGGGLFLIWLGSYFREPLEAYHKILVAVGQEGTVFEESVILVMQHNPTGAFGIVMNKDGVGGPVSTDEVYVLHTTDVMLSGSVKMDDLSLAMAGGEEAVHELERIEKKPKWYMTAKGYTGWSGRQLDRELRRDAWKAIDYDLKLVTETPREEMYAIANKRPETIFKKQMIKDEKEIEGPKR